MKITAKKYLSLKHKIFNLIIGQPLFFPFFIEHFNRQQASNNRDITLHSFKNYIFHNANIIYYRSAYKKTKNFIFNLLSNKQLYIKKKFTYNLFRELNFFKCLFLLPYKPKLKHYNSCQNFYLISLKTIKRIINKFSTSFFFIPRLKFTIIFYHLLKLKKA